MREIDRRVRFLRKRLDGLIIVDKPPSDASRVYFGAWVDLEDADGAISTYRIVGPDEFDIDPIYISMDAPLARALLGKRLDDEIEVPISGRPRYSIAAIRYEPGAST